MLFLSWGSLCFPQTGTGTRLARITGKQIARTLDSILIPVCGLLVSCPSSPHFRISVSDRRWQTVVRVACELWWTRQYPNLPALGRGMSWHWLLPEQMNETFTEYLPCARHHFQEAQGLSGTCRLSAEKTPQGVFECSCLPFQRRKCHRSQASPRLGPKLCHQCVLSFHSTFGACPVAPPPRDCLVGAVHLFPADHPQSPVPLPPSQTGTKWVVVSGGPFALRIGCR